MATVVAMVADGLTVAEIIDELAYLTAEDVTAALRYAAEEMRERELPLRHHCMRFPLDENLSGRCWLVATPVGRRSC